MGTERIKFEMSALDVFYAMSEGNPGALRVCMDIMTQGEMIDPEHIFKGLGHIMTLDTLGIYGSRIWMLYKDACHEDLPTMLAVLRANHLGLAGVTDGAVNHATDNYGDGLDLKAIMEAVQTRLPRFNASTPQ
jgi:hypothetical protein